MSMFKIENVSAHYDNSFPLNYTHLWIWHVDKIPPHIGISADRKYYSLKSTGKDEAMPVDQVIELIYRKKIKVLAAELTDFVELEEVQKVFAEFDSTKSGEITCLDPVKRILNQSNARKLEELLIGLEENSDIKTYRVFNIEEDEFEGLPSYDVDEIHARLQKLENDRKA